MNKVWLPKLQVQYREATWRYASYYNIQVIFSSYMWKVPPWNFHFKDQTDSHNQLQDCGRFHDQLLKHYYNLQQVRRNFKIKLTPKNPCNSTTFRCWREEFGNCRLLFPNLRPWSSTCNNENKYRLSQHITCLTPSCTFGGGRGKKPNNTKQLTIQNLEI